MYPPTSRFHIPAVFECIPVTVFHAPETLNFASDGIVKIKTAFPFPPDLALAPPTATPDS